MTTQDIDPSRRRLLSAALLALFTGGGLGGCRAWPITDTPDGLSAEQLAAMVGERDAAARIGEAYLRDWPAERDLGVLLASLDSALPGRSAAGTPFGDLERVVREEYRRGDVVRVRGWLLSRSEARLYAVISLL